jgi:hypothetical protein
LLKGKIDRVRLRRGHHRGRTTATARTHSATKGAKQTLKKRHRLILTEIEQGGILERIERGHRGERRARLRIRLPRGKRAVV